MSTKSFENTLLSAACKKNQWKLWQKERGLDVSSPLDKLLLLKRRCHDRLENVHHWFLCKPALGERRPLAAIFHPRILLPQNRSLPHLLAAPFPRQLEPRCNTLDFASKIRVPKGCCLSPVGSVRCFKMRCILRSPLATRTPLETQSQGKISSRSTRFFSMV